MEELIFSVTDFVAVFNQTISYAYPSLLIEGEVDNFKISKNRWVYFSLKDDDASVRFFGTVNQLSGPVEDGMLLRVRGVPFLHPQYGFSINVQTMQPVGEGSIKRAASLLEAKLKAEGLFDVSRKRPLPYPPTSIGLIASLESAAYQDFIKILSERWGGISISVFDVQVQGENSPTQVLEALDFFNTHKDPVDLIVIIRGGGSPEDLSGFNSETVTRAVSTSRIPTLVAIGHESDITLAELAADRRGSTPTHAAELVAPDKKEVILNLNSYKTELPVYLQEYIKSAGQNIADLNSQLGQEMDEYFMRLGQELSKSRELIEILSPNNALKRGYAIIRNSGLVTSVKQLKKGDQLSAQMKDGVVEARVSGVKYASG